MNLPKTEPREPAKPKGSAENPFGTAITDVARMNQIAEERLKRDLEREAKKKAEEEKRREGDRPDRNFKNPTSPRESESWRNNNNTSSNFGRRVEPTKAPERKPSRPPVVVDSEGFREQTSHSRSTNRGWETPGTGSAARASQNEALSKQNNHVKPEKTITQTKVEKPTNRFDGLGEEDI